MAQTVRDVMTTNLVTCPSSAPLKDAAGYMRDRDIGDVLVVDDGSICGIVTDRDIVVRCVAEGGDVRDATVGDVCTADLTTVSADTTIEDAARLMRDNALRRLPVVDRGKPVGIVTLGDLAVQADPSSALGGISAARPNG
jgi:CBS domain-containing protein